MTNKQLAQLNPSFSYQVYLSDNATGATKELNANIRAAIRSCAQSSQSKIPLDFLQRTNSFLQPWWDFLKQHYMSEIPLSTIMTEDVETYMVESYQKQGFFPSKQT